MAQGSFPLAWLNQFTDPYAILGIPVTADERRIQKRYRTIAKVLHPDHFVHADEASEQFATNLLTRLVNPAYEKLRHEKGRKEHLALLRFKARQLNRQETPLNPSSKLAQQLVQRPVEEVEVFYEQAIAQLAESQFQTLDQFGAPTEQLCELNLVYLQLKLREVFVAERRTGLIAAPAPAPTPAVKMPVTAEPGSSYAQRHYKRAQEYAKNSNWSKAEQELRDAIRLESNKSDYHALLGWVYLKKQLPGMAKVYMGQALKLNPEDPLATKYAVKLGLRPAQQSTAKNGTKQPSSVLSKNGKVAPKSGDFARNGAHPDSRNGSVTRSYAYVSTNNQKGLLDPFPAWLDTIKEFLSGLFARSNSSNKEKPVPPRTHARQHR
jgi:curved DNA-binding protein CbpA